MGAQTRGRLATIDHRHREGLIAITL